MLISLLRDQKFNFPSGWHILQIDWDPPLLPTAPPPALSVLHKKIKPKEGAGRQSHSNFHISRSVQLDRFRL